MNIVLTDQIITSFDPEKPSKATMVVSAFDGLRYGCGAVGNTSIQATCTGYALEKTE